MEALHEAYRQIHVVEDSDDHKRHYSSLEERGRVNRAVSPSSPPQHTKQSLQPAFMCSNESGQTLHYHTINSMLGNGGLSLSVCMMHWSNWRNYASAKAASQFWG